MKRIAGVLIVAMALGIFSTANATLIGLTEADLRYPDVLFDLAGTISYDSSTGTLTISAWDTQIKFLNGEVYTLTQYSGTTYEGIQFSLQINVDSSGNLIYDSDYDMTETVKKDKGVEIKDITFPNGTIVLQGDVYAFGWEFSTNTARFDFLLKNMSGGFVTQGWWPQGPPYGPPTGILITEAKLPSGSFSWTNNWEATNVKGDKAPLPEPTTLLLLGSGIAIAGIVARRRRK